MPNSALLDCYTQGFPWLVPEKIFWQEISRDGTVDKLAGISGHFGSRKEDCQGASSGGRDFVGLSFRYQSGMLRTIGDVTGLRRQELQLGEWDKIAWIDITQHGRAEISKIQASPALSSTPCSKDSVC
jgi:hypothetical protein